MFILAMISTFGSLLLVMAQQSSTESASEDTGVQFKMVIALIVAIVLIVTILVIVIIILFALRGKSKKKRQQQLSKLSKQAKRKASGKKESNDDNYNMVFAAKGQPENEKAKDVGASGSFVFSGHSTDKPIPIEETYATALQNTDASDSGFFERRPTDLIVKKPPQPKNSKSVVIKDNKSKSGV